MDNDQYGRKYDENLKRNPNGKKGRNPNEKERNPNVLAVAVASGNELNEPGLKSGDQRAADTGSSDRFRLNNRTSKHKIQNTKHKIQNTKGKNTKIQLDANQGLQQSLELAAKITQ